MLIVIDLYMLTEAMSPEKKAACAVYITITIMRVTSLYLKTRCWFHKLESQLHY